MMDRRNREDRKGDGMRKQSRHLENIETIDTRDTNMLRRFVTEQGKITPHDAYMKASDKARFEAVLKN